MKILLVEDDALQRTAVSAVLEANHYVVERVGDGQAGLELAVAVGFDLLLVDVHLPKLNGIDLCRQLRSQGYCQPILLMTADDTDADVVAGFDAGADDYIHKPCAPEVLLARVRTWLRRSGAINAQQQPTTTLTWGTLCLDVDAGRVTINGQIILLTATEYNLLELFLRHPERIFSRTAILDQLWGFDNAPTDRAIVTHVKDLRKKLKTGGLAEEIIETVYGMGYRLKSATQASPANANSMPQLASQKATQAAIDQVRKRFQNTFVEQVAVIEQAKTNLLMGNLDPALQHMAQQEAHKLAGSLASFGYPQGSKLARTIEHLLMDEALQREYLPRFAELVTALQQELAREPIAIKMSSPSSGSTLRVLVVDDDAVLTERLQAEASAWNCRFKIAADLKTARSLLMTHSPDVVLLDLSFPVVEEDGLTLLQEIHERFPKLPVIVFTGRDSLSDRLAASRLGARQFLHKPATTAQIFQTITRILDKLDAAKAKILIVDDDPAMLNLLSNMLTPWGLDVMTLPEPQHFWNVLVTTTPDLVLLDLEMPEVSGFELCQVVRQDAEWGDLPILVVTGHTDEQSLQQTFAAGADDFIAKPVLGPELVTRVLSRIDRHRLGQKTGHLGNPRGS